MTVNYKEHLAAAKEHNRELRHAVKRLVHIHELKTRINDLLEKKNMTTWEAFNISGIYSAIKELDDDFLEDAIFHLQKREIENALFDGDSSAAWKARGLSEWHLTEEVYELMYNSSHMGRFNAELKKENELKEEEEEEEEKNMSAGARP